MAKTNEPIWWSLFGAGGVVAALLMPITIFLTGIGVYAGWVSERALYDFIHHPLGRIGLFLLISLPLFHAAHRTRFTLIDIGLKNMSGLLAVLLYGAAIVGTVLAIIFLVQL